jgi:four helix bundle protein
LADELVTAIYGSTKSFPAEERFGLVSQLRRSAVSVAVNIVEGCGRRSEADFLRFLDIAFASVREVEYLIGLSHRLGYMSSEDRKALASLQSRTAAALAALMKTLGS